MAFDEINGLQRRRGKLMDVTSVKDPLYVALLLLVCKRQDSVDVHCIQSHEPAARDILRVADAL